MVKGLIIVFAVEHNIRSYVMFGTLLADMYSLVFTEVALQAVTPIA